MNCMCLALLTRSWMRNTTKLAGTKDMAKMTQMDTKTSTEVVTLEVERTRKTNPARVRSQVGSGVQVGTHRATWDSCSLVRFRGWLKAVMPYRLASLPGGRLARRMPLLITLMKAATLCQPLLLNQI